jgi:outer membrane protein TolC
MIAAVVLAALSLGTVLDRAVTVSPDVTQARERVHEQAALLAAARASASPALTANYSQTPQAGNGNNTLTQRLVTLGGQITLGDYFTFSPVVRQAQANLDAAQFDLLETQRTERVKTGGIYFSALRAQAELSLRDQAVAGAQSDLHAAELRFRAGDAPRLDIVRAQVSLARAQGDRNAAATSLVNAQSALGIELDEPVTLDLSAAFPPPIASVDPQTFILRALAQRSDLASAERAVTAESAAVAVAQRGNLPAIVINAGYTSGTDTGIFVRGPSANVQLSFPISRAAADRAEAERARLAQAQARAQSIRKNISVEVGNAARTYAGTARATQIATRARIAAQQELAATQTGYRSGASSSLDVADARRTYVQAALDELTAIYARAEAAAALEELLGP